MSGPNESHKVRGDGYYRFFPGDYLRDTMHLSLIEDGVYRRLLDFYYCEERLSSDPERLYRICRASSPDERKAVDFIVSTFFQADGGCLINRRAEREIIARRAFLAEQARKARLGAVARWGPKETPEMPGGIAGGMPGALPEGCPDPCPDDAQASASASALASKPKKPRKPKPRPANATKCLAVRPSGKKGTGGNGSGQEYASFIAALSPKERAALERVCEMAQTGGWKPLHCRRHLLNEGFGKKTTLAMKFIVFPAAVQ